MGACSRSSNRPRHSLPTEPWRSIWRLVSLVAKDDRSNITETAVYIQVRTVVWEDGGREAPPIRFAATPPPPRLALRQSRRRKSFRISHNKYSPERKQHHSIPLPPINPSQPFQILTQKSFPLPIAH
jgi:hypothetical protein